jgi:hypothetical protein
LVHPKTTRLISKVSKRIYRTHYAARRPWIRNKWATYGVLTVKGCAKAAATEARTTKNLIFGLWSVARREKLVVKSR